MTDTTITREASLGRCPQCHGDLNAEVQYLVGSVHADPLPPDVKSPAVPVGMTAALTLTGLRIDHACGSAKKPPQRAEVVAAGSIDGPHSRACGIIPHQHGSTCSLDCPTCHPNRTISVTAGGNTGAGS